MIVLIWHSPHQHHLPFPLPPLSFHYRPRETKNILIDHVHVRAMLDMQCDVHALLFIPVLWQCCTVLYSTCCYTCIQPEVVDEAAGPDNDDATRLDDHRTGASPPRGTAPVWAARPPRAYGGAAVVGQPTLVRWLSRLATPPIQGPRLTTPSPHAAEVGLRRPWPCGRENPPGPKPGSRCPLGNRPKGLLYNATGASLRPR